LGLLSNARISFGDLDGAIVEGQKALALGQHLDDFAVQAATRFRLGMAYWSLGNYAAGEQVLRENVHRLVGPTGAETYGMLGPAGVLSRLYLILCLVERGEFSAAGPCGAEAVELAELAGNRWGLVCAYIGLGLPHVARGDGAAAIPPLERAMA